MVDPDNRLIIPALPYNMDYNIQHGVDLQLFRLAL